MTLVKSKLNILLALLKYFNITCVKQFHKEAIYDKINEGCL